MMIERLKFACECKAILINSKLTDITNNVSSHSQTVWGVATPTSRVATRFRCSGVCCRYGPFGLLLWFVMTVLRGERNVLTRQEIPE